MDPLVFLAGIASAVTIIGFALRYLPKKKKADLRYDVKTCSHWYEEEYNRSGLDVIMYISNQGKISTTINNIKILNVKGIDTFAKLKEQINVNFEPFILDVKDEERFDCNWNFRDIQLKENELEVSLEIEHTYDADRLSLTSYLSEK